MCAKATTESPGDGARIFCLLGKSGEGKSSSGKTFLGEPENTILISGDDGESVTRKAVVCFGKWRGSGSAVGCVDTPGLGAQDLSDDETMHNIAAVLLKDAQHVHVFLVVVNGTSPRIDRLTTEMLRRFKLMFGDDFLRHVMIVVTHWNHDTPSNEDKMARKRKNVNEGLKWLGHDFDFQCAFLDNDLITAGKDMQIFDAELARVWEFASSVPAFCFKDVGAATRTERALSLEARISTVLAIPGAAAGPSSRDGVIHQGWLLWGGKGGREWLWASLRRQYLYFFKDHEETEPMGPSSSDETPGRIDLVGCVCSGTPTGNRFFSLMTHYFTIYRPVQEAGSRQLDFEFGLDDQTLCRKWVLFLQEAAQMSQSGHRIREFKEDMRSAKTEALYANSIGRVENETMVIPMEWMRASQEADIRQIREDRDPPTPRTEWKRTLKQVGKDYSREPLFINDEEFKVGDLSKGEDEKNEEVQVQISHRLACHIAQHILGGVEKPQQPLEEERLQAESCALARDVLLTCSRTVGGGDTLDAVQAIFKNDDLVHVVPDTSSVGDVVRLQVLREAPRMGPGSIGVPAFESDSSVDGMTMEQVRAMDTSHNFLLVPAARRENYVSPSDIKQCMRCGVGFDFIRWGQVRCVTCGGLVCGACSRQRLRVTAPKTPVPSFHAAASMSEVVDQPVCAGTEQRVCFLCYQKAVVDDLSARRVAGVCPSEAEIAGDKGRTRSRAASEGDVLARASSISGCKGFVASGACDIAGSGADVPPIPLSKCNGEYHAAGDHNGKQKYANENGAVLFFDAEWKIQFQYDSTECSFSSAGCAGPEPLIGQWWSSSHVWAAVRLHKFEAHFVEWMWADAAPVGMQYFAKVSERDPIRWSRNRPFDKAISELRAVKDIRRPVRMRYLVSKRSLRTFCARGDGNVDSVPAQMYSDVGKAIQALEKWSCAPQAVRRFTPSYTRGSSSPSSQSVSRASSFEFDGRAQAGSQPKLTPIDSEADSEARDQGLDGIVVSVEMASRFRVTNQDLETLFHLSCKYVRLIRAHGRADAGRILISIGRSR